MDKRSLRKELIARRDALRPEEIREWSAAIRRRLAEIPELRSAASVFTYVSQANEVDTHGLIGELLSRDVLVAVPLITGEGVMEPQRIRSLDDLEPGTLGILEPATREPFEETPSVSICPGVAFGPRGERLGRGKAFYDRYLARHPGTFAIGVCYEFQVLEEVPVSESDRPVSVVVTERRRIEAGAGT